MTEIYQCDLDDKTKRCKKCRTHITDLIGKPKLCAVIGKEEFDKVWHMIMCGIDGYEQNLLKALEEK